MTRLINTAFTLKDLMQDHSEVMTLPISTYDSFLTSEKLTPVNLPFVNYQPDLSYHTSAILASLVNNVTLPWRQKTQQSLMHDQFNFFDTYKYKV